MIKTFSPHLCPVIKIVAWLNWSNEKNECGCSIITSFVPIVICPSLLVLSNVLLDLNPMDKPVFADGLTESERMVEDV